ncbi:hypothetical protein FKM82_000961 [Ascaphus truei]
MRQEMELAMKMLEKDVCEKQDALAALRQQLDDLRALKHELSFKLQSSDLAVKQKSELNSRLEEKTNQMAATIKQLEQRLRQAERERQSAEDANRLFKQDFGDKIESLQLEVDQLRKQCSQHEVALQRERDRRLPGHHKRSPGTTNTPLGSQRPPERNSMKMDAEHHAVGEAVRAQRAGIAKHEFQMNNSPSSRSKCEDEDSETRIPQMCQLCRSEASITLPKNECRNCRGLFCSTCSANELPLPSSINPERVCNPCHKRLIEQYSSSPS